MSDAPHGPLVFGLPDSGGGDLTAITSLDGSVTIVDGTGPIPDLSVPPPGASVGATAPANVSPDNSPSAGASAEASRVDHVHRLAADVPVGTGTANAAGSNNSVSRSDHVHLTNLAIQDESIAQGNVHTVDFVGAGVSASVAAGKATVTIAGGGGGAGDYAQVALTGSAGIGSGSATTISGMSIAIPSNNNFNLNFNADMRPDASSVFEYFLAKNLVEISGTRRRVGPLAADRPGSVQILSIALVNTDTITARVIRISGAGSITFHDRILQALEH